MIACTRVQASEPYACREGCMGCRLLVGLKFCVLELGTGGGAGVGVRDLLQVAHGCLHKVAGCTGLHAQGCRLHIHMPVGQVAWVAGCWLG